MLPIQTKKALINAIPSSIVVDGSTYQLQRTFGKASLNDIVSPTINIAIISDGKRYSRSIDDCTVITDTTVTGSDLRTAIVRYTIGATVQKLTRTETIKKTNSSLYKLAHTPVLDITSIGSYVKGVDYKLENDHETLNWLKTGPAINTNFSVNYEYVEDGYWIVYGIADYLMQDILASLNSTLRQYNADVVKVGDIVDLSAIYTNDTLSVCVFDVQLVYPYKWTRAATEEDGVAIESIDVDLYVNDDFAGTIHAP